ncbi:hypothetical protein OEB99_06280 [Actinotalea sp. M2MS4P-6]|uniref:hypothetical protein n=1 Tax=Actinotalea sp. M2MS4P-6 TaxID=2983762 RepID=UPI0021E4B8A1|nr:hypothetical protein [Actinotalea sp. M2MS4P-6]MCV2393907.1 hypothetical protein [Actinotalea sp. M2MS4P-6]
MSINRAVASLSLAAVSVGSVSFVPAFKASAAIFWFAALCLFGTALAFLVRDRRRRSRKPGPAQAGAGPTTVAAIVGFATAVAVALATNSATDSASTAMDDRIVGSTVVAESALNSAGGMDALPVRSESILVTNESVRATAEEVARASASLTKMADAPSRAAVATALRDGYVSQSGLKVDVDSATAYQGSGGQRVVNIPLVGTNLPEVSKIAFISQGRETTVVEIAAEMVSENSVAVAIWQDGVPIHSELVTAQNQSSLTGPAVGNGFTVQDASFSWSKLNSCLSSAGISWAIITVIGIVCAAVCAGTAGAACAPCIASAAGFTGGTISYCVWKASH